VVLLLAAAGLLLAPLPSCSSDAAPARPDAVDSGADASPPIEGPVTTRTDDLAVPLDAPRAGETGKEAGVLDGGCGSH
jgi:hypothetical protein